MGADTHDRPPRPSEVNGGAQEARHDRRQRKAGGWRDKIGTPAEQAKRGRNSREDFAAMAIAEVKNGARPPKDA